MAICSSCNSNMADDAAECPKCGKTIKASQLEDIQTETTDWQKFVIAVTIILLIAIGFTFYSAKSREDRATQRIFSASIERILQTAAMQTGLIRQFGVPAWQLVAKTKSASATVVFGTGPLSQTQASMFGRAVCAGLAQTYVQKGYIPRHVNVVVAGNEPGGQTVYGEAIYNGNIDALGWEPAAR